MSTIFQTSELPEGICVLADGGCLNNQMPVAERRMYGSMTVFNKRVQIESHHYIGQNETAIKHPFKFGHFEQGSPDPMGHASNQLAELLTIREAVNYAGSLQCRMKKQDGRKLTITILCDSGYALGMAQGTMKASKKAHPDTLRAIQELRDSINYAQIYGATLIWQHADEQWVKSILGH